MIGDCGHAIPGGQRLWPITRYDVAAGHFRPQAVCFECMMLTDPRDDAHLRRQRPRLGSIYKAGRQVSTAKLDEHKVREIKALLKVGELSQREIGRRFGVTISAVNQIKFGRAWAHVAAA